MGGADRPRIKHHPRLAESFNRVALVTPAIPIRIARDRGGQQIDDHLKIGVGARAWRQQHHRARHLGVVHRPFECDVRAHRPADNGAQPGESQAMRHQRVFRRHQVADRVAREILPAPIDRARRIRRRPTRRRRSRRKPAGIEELAGAGIMLIKARGGRLQAWSCSSRMALSCASATACPASHRQCAAPGRRCRLRTGKSDSAVVLRLGMRRGADRPRPPPPPPTPPASGSAA